MLRLRGGEGDGRGDFSVPEWAYRVKRFALGAGRASDGPSRYDRPFCRSAMPAGIARRAALRDVLALEARIDDQRAGMATLESSGHHCEPMYPVVEIPTILIEYVKI